MQKKSANHQVRPAQPEDIAYLIESQIKMARETEGMELDFATVAQGVAAVFGPEVKGKYYLAVQNTGEAEVRLGCMLTLVEWSDWRNGNVIWIHSVYVEPEFRREGVFSRMYAFLKEQVNASDGKLRGLRLYVDQRNESAIRTYEKLGMNRDHYSLFEWMK